MRKLTMGCTGAMMAAILLACHAAPRRATAASRPVVGGTVSTRLATVLRPGAVLRVVLLDVSRQDAASATVGEQIFSPAPRLPARFEVAYDPARVDPRGTYVVRATATLDGRLTHTTTLFQPVLTNGRPARADLVLEPVR